jgi:hypothetical protein
VSKVFVVNNLAKILGCIVPKLDPIEVEAVQPTVDVSELEPNTLVMMQLVKQMTEMRQSKDLSALKPKEDSVTRVVCLPGGSFVPNLDWSDALANEHFKNQNVLKGHLTPYPQYSDPSSLGEAGLKEMCEHILVDTVLQELIKADPRVMAVSIYNARLTALEELRKVLYA